MAPNGNNLCRLCASIYVSLFLAFTGCRGRIVAPANEAFRAATAVTMPPNWFELRLNWENGHAIRFALQFAALCVLCLSAIFPTNRNSTKVEPPPE